MGLSSVFFTSVVTSLFYFLNIFTLLKFCAHPFFSWIWWGSVWSLYQAVCKSVSFISSPEVLCFCLELFFYPLILPNSVFFYVLGKSVTFHSIEEVAFCRRCPMGCRTVSSGPLHKPWAPCYRVGLWLGCAGGRAGPWLDCGVSGLLCVGGALSGV